VIAPRKSLATDQDRVTFEPVEGDVAPAEFPAPVPAWFGALTQQDRSTGWSRRVHSESAGRTLLTLRLRSGPVTRAFTGTLCIA
jgi:hypothetical protein